MRHLILSNIKDVSGQPVDILMKETAKRSLAAERTDEAFAFERKPEKKGIRLSKLGLLETENMELKIN